MQLVTNTTPYLGKISFKFEKHPEYSGSTLLNKIHLNLGFTKLVSRMRPTDTKKEGWLVDKEKVKLIEEFTGGKISKYEWWHIKGEEGKEDPKTYSKPTEEQEETFHGVLDNSFIAPDGTYIGSIKDAWWYYNNNLKVCKEYPPGVALKYKDGAYKNRYLGLSDKYFEGYYGFSHRGGNLFKLGDRLFDENYEPIKSDYQDWEWAGWEEKYQESIAKAEKEGDSWWLDDLKSDGVTGHIPFRFRGKNVIKTWDEALQAAINMSKYLG